MVVGILRMFSGLRQACFPGFSVIFSGFELRLGFQRTTLYCTSAAKSTIALVLDDCCYPPPTCSGWDGTGMHTIHCISELGGCPIEGGAKVELVKAIFSGTDVPVHLYRTTALLET